jgi:hypothetical protein
MTSFSASTDRDANRVPLNGGLYPFRTKKSITFAGGTTNAWGDDAGTRDGGALFTVTGLVEIKVLGECTVDLVGGATVEVGITGATAIFCAQITDTTLDVGELYLNDTTPASYFIVGEEEAAADNFPAYILNGNDIILTTTTTNTTSGAIDFFALWRPISDDGSVVASSL